MRVSVCPRCGLVSCKASHDAALLLEGFQEGWSLIVPCQSGLGECAQNLEDHGHVMRVNTIP